MGTATRRELLAALATAWALPSGAWAAEAASLTVRTVGASALPDVPLLSMLGRPQKLPAVLAGDGLTLLNFVFTTCSSTCSMQTAQLAQVQRQWRADAGPLQLVSLTIDPDNDTPQQLQRFAASFGIRDGWMFYTGQFEHLLQVQRHFDVYRGSKIAHPPVLFARRQSRAPWTRVEGFPETQQLVTLLRELKARG